MKTLIIILGILVSFSLEAKVYTQRYGTDNFYKAKTSLNFIRFDLEGTRAKVFPADVIGVVKRFDAKVNTSRNIVKSAKIDFLVEDIDTDLAVRNKRMRRFCLNEEKYPKLSIRTKNAFRYSAKSQNVKAILTIKGREKPVMLKMNSYKNSNKLYVKGSSKVSLKELEIPDPSTFFHKVEDEFDLSFSLIIDL